MNIDDLYQRVSEAILRAEALDPTRPSAATDGAYLTISFLEEEIAEAMPVTEEEGSIARRGAVRAAANARMHLRAKDLADRYLAEPGAPPELVDELRRMVAGAEAAPKPSLRSNVLVVPGARYRIHDEAA